MHRPLANEGSRKALNLLHGRGPGRSLSSPQENTLRPEARRGLCGKQTEKFSRRFFQFYIFFFGRNDKKRERNKNENSGRRRRESMAEMSEILSMKEKRRKNNRIDGFSASLIFCIKRDLTHFSMEKVFFFF